MNELIKVASTENGNVVSAKELHEFLEVKSRFNDWIINRIKKYGFVENQDFVTLTKNLVSGGSEKEYALKIDVAKELAMVEGNEKGKQARQYFINCEKSLKDLQKPKELTRKEILTLALEAEERAEKAEKTISILTHVNKTYTATEIGQELGFKSAMAFNKALHDKKIQYKQNETWILYSKFSHLAYVDIKQEVLDNGKIVYHRRWTQIGREFLVKLFAEKYK